VTSEPIGRPTPIHITKYDGSYHRRWPCYYVARKGVLYLLASRAGEHVTRTPEPSADPAPWRIPADSDVYAWEDRWYNVARSRRDGRMRYYVNVATPIEFDGESFHCIDLDLDVAWWTDEAPQVLDEDEFLDHAQAMSYPADVIERARSAVDEVLRLIQERAFPFDRRA
jgi:protein associated with RNAse G/E